MAAIHQFVAGFTTGDAISNEAVVMRGIFRQWGYESEIFSEAKRILPRLRKQARDVGDYMPAASPDDIVLLHLSIGSTVNDAFRALPVRKAILYHNITPAHYFELVNPRTAFILAEGRRQIETLAGTAAVNMADSRFNAEELAALGYRDVRVLPLILDLDALRATPDRRTLERYRDGRTNILFVGRCAPNKKLEDLVTLFAHFQKFVEPNSRLLHVGSHDGTERYHYLLLTQVRELGLTHVDFAGAIPQAQLNACYQAADIFVCMSEHEGFCIPVLESMLNGVPVMAYAGAAVPETMNQAGVLFHEKRYEAIAELMGEVVRNTRLRREIVERQHARIARYAARNLADELRDHLDPLLTAATNRGRPS